MLRTLGRMDTRTTIIQAAASVFAQHGFRGSTTRRIADAAAVNEVTIFRYFGSKEVLLQEAINHSVGCEISSPLPSSPVNPEAELAGWCAVVIDHLRSRRGMIRKCMSETEERPEMKSAAAATPIRATSELCAYFGALKSSGFINEDFDASAAAAMMMGALFHDAMGRDMMPDAYPEPADQAPQRYARLLLRAIGVSTSSVTTDGRHKRGKQITQPLT